MFDKMVFDPSLFEAKMRVVELGYQKMNMFELVRCSKIDVQVRSMYDEMVFDTSIDAFFLNIFREYLHNKMKNHLKSTLNQEEMINQKSNYQSHKSTWQGIKTKKIESSATESELELDTFSK